MGRKVASDASRASLPNSASVPPPAASIQQQMIEKIRRNRISTTEVADCLDKSGAIPRVSALNRGFHRVGPVFWSYGYNESNWEFHEQIQDAPAGSILLTESFDCGERAIYGELVAKFLLLYKEVVALVMCGPVRDAPHLIKENWPIWCSGVTPVGCFNRRSEKTLASRTIEKARQKYDGAIAVCDDSGVVIISADQVKVSMLERLDRIEEQEDIWFDCIDRRKWTTFETVCLKRYAVEENQPAARRNSAP